MREEPSRRPETIPPPGRYRHYKGNDYVVLGVARHSETQEELVVYRPEYGERGLWVRPKDMFLETVPAIGQPRFRRIETKPESPTAANLFDDLPTQLPAELLTTLVTSANVRIERIVSRGHRSPDDFWYDQPQREWVVVLKGAARLRFEDHAIEMRPGDAIDIPAHVRHRVDWTTPDEPTIWLAVFYDRA